MKRKYDVTQRGWNPDYPKEALIWIPGNPIPEWLSDRAKISGIQGNQVILATRPRTSGGYEILEPSGKNALVILERDDSVVLFSETHPILSVTPHQLELLYDMHLRN